MKTENREVYISDDGKVFDTVEACQAHERDEIKKAERINTLDVWLVRHSFEATEGRGHLGSTYIVTDASTPAIIQFCLDKFGQPLREWYGDSYFEAWILSNESFKSPNPFKTAVDNSKNPMRGYTCDLVFLSGTEIDHPDLQNRVFPWPRKAKGGAQ